MATTRPTSSALAGMRALSNSALVQEAARKALSAQELEKTLARFRELCVDKGADVTALEQVAETLRNAGFKNELMNLLREALELPNANPHVGALWVRRVVTSKIWDHSYPDYMDVLCKEGEVGRCAVLEFLELAGAKRRVELVRTAVSRHGKWLRGDNPGWAVAGRALVQCRCYGSAARWMAGWRDKPAIDPPTLQALVLALRATGKKKEAGEVIQLASSSSGGMEVSDVLKLWIAEDLAFGGDTEKASATFKLINNSGWDDDLLAIYYMVRGVLRVQKAHDSGKHEAFTMGKERIEELFRRKPVYKRDVFVRREYRRCLTRMAMDSGQWIERVFAAWRSAESPWFIAPLLLIPGLQLFLPCYLYRLCVRRRGIGK